MFYKIKTEVKNAFVENKSAIIASAFILFISLILGYVFAPSLHSYLNPVVDDLTNKVETGVVQLTFKDIFHKLRLDLSIRSIKIFIKSNS